MSSIGTTLLDSLRSVERPGDFCVGGIREIFMPTIDVDGVGRIAFPILPVQAERLVAIAEAAPYGRGEETVVDRDVRRTWQVNSAKVRIGGRHWDKTLAELVADIALGLGVSEPVAADFYKLLVYDAGSFFVDHRDTEKAPGMFATMVLVLPSTHSGGELVIKHLGREVVLDPRPEEPSEIGFAAFYADCVHEVRPVTTGYRLTLVYNLRFVGKRRSLKAPDYRAEHGRVVELLRSWASAEDEPDKLIVPLGACLYAGGAVVQCTQGRRCRRGVRAGQSGRRGGLRSPPRPGVDRGERQRRTYRLLRPWAAGVATRRATKNSRLPRSLTGR